MCHNVLNANGMLFSGIPHQKAISYDSAGICGQIGFQIFHVHRNIIFIKVLYFVKSDSATAVG
jgi:hypothetical protein